MKGGVKYAEEKMFGKVLNRMEEGEGMELNTLEKKSRVCKVSR